MQLRAGHDKANAARDDHKPATSQQPPTTPATQVPSLPPSASQSATSYDWIQLLRDDYRIVIGLDIGTKFSSACWQRLPRNATLKPGQLIETRNIRVEGKHRIPTEAAIVVDEDTGKAHMVFGYAGDESLRCGMIEDKSVFRLLKLSLVPEFEDELAEDALMMAVVRTTHEAALEASPKDDVQVFCEFDQTHKACPRISDVSDVFREYLGYLWDKIKLDIQQVSNLASEDLQRIFTSEKTAVALAVPAIWSPSTIDQFKKLLVAAGLPNIHIVSKPKCAAAVIALEEQRRLADTYTVEHQD